MNLPYNFKLVDIPWIPQISSPVPSFPLAHTSSSPHQGYPPPSYRILLAGNYPSTLSAMSDEKVSFAARESAENASNTPFSKSPSANTSRTHVPSTSDPKADSTELKEVDTWESAAKQHHLPGHGESALPEDKKGEEVENIEDDWECDPANARNWSSRKKWTAVTIVSFATLLSAGMVF